MTPLSPPLVRWLAPSCPCVCWGDAGARVLFVWLSSVPALLLGLSAACAVFLTSGASVLCAPPPVCPACKVHLAVLCM